MLLSAFAVQSRSAPILSLLADHLFIVMPELWQRYSVMDRQYFDTYTDIAAMDRSHFNSALDPSPLVGRWPIAIAPFHHNAPQRKPFAAVGGDSPHDLSLLAPSSKTLLQPVMIGHCSSQIRWSVTRTILSMAPSRFQRLYVIPTTCRTFTRSNCASIITQRPLDSLTRALLSMV